jgi:hypothetical protein
MAIARTRLLSWVLLTTLLLGGLLSAWIVPTAAAADRTITIASPLPGTTVTSPVQVNGSGTMNPFESRLSYRVLDVDGKVIGQGDIATKGDLGKPYTFSGQIAFNAIKRGPGRIEIEDVNQSGSGPPLAIASVEVSLQVAGAGGGSCYAQTDECIQGRFLEYWTANGGLDINGFPLTGEFRQKLEDGKEYIVQYFERVRLEYHPEVADPQYQVLLGQFGRGILIGVRGAPTARASQETGATYFDQTGHNLGPAFGAHWTENGGLAQFGYPLTELFTQTLEDGKDNQVQYFERARFELHPEASAQRYQVQLGQFGRQILNQSRGATPRTISIFAPPPGATVQCAFQVQGTVSVVPTERTFSYRVTASDGGQVLAQGPVTVQGEYGKAGTFVAQITLPPGFGGAARVTVQDISEGDGSVLASASLDVTVQAATRP